MVFSSIEFLFVFLPVFLAAYFLDARLANPVLLIFSLIFYFLGEGVFILVMLASIGLNALAGRLIAGDPSRARLWLAAGVAANLGLLGYFKYLGFLAAELFGVTPGGSEGIHLPLGISFFTFQAISYLVDLYRGDCAVERRPARIALYISMFPQLIAGPIVRFASVREALGTRSVTLRHLYFAFVFFSAGLAAKVLVADAVAPVADQVFAADPAQLRADAAAAGILAYTLQIYFDFLGYSLMAVGLGHMLGFQFPQNFNHPYVAASVTEFWRRWHMSLSSWFRDYVYIPLGGNRHGAARTYLNLWIVFLLTGFWHGAAWTFVLWGALHGTLLTLERAGLGTLLARLPTAIGIGYTLLAVMAGWVLFRADGLGAATDLALALGAWEGAISAAGVLTNEARLSALAGLLLAGPWIGRALGRWIEIPSFQPWPERLSAARTLPGLLLYGTLFLCAATKVLAGSYSPFIYFRF